MLLRTEKKTHLPLEYGRCSHEVANLAPVSQVSVERVASRLERRKLSHSYWHEVR